MRLGQLLSSALGWMLGLPSNCSWVTRRPEGEPLSASPRPAPPEEWGYGKVVVAAPMP